MSFIAETYFAGYGANTSDEITDETVSLVSNNMLCKVLIDEGDKHCISTDASLELREGYELKLIQLDVSGDKAQIELLRNGKSVDTGIISNTPATYIYTRDLETVEDVPHIAIHVDSIIACTELDMIVIDGIFQISGDYISVKPGDNYGEMEIVNTSSDTIRMENYDNITLLEGGTIDLMGDIYIVVADNGTLRFAPVAELTEPGTYEVRGAVHSPDVSQSAAIVWNASNFAAFWYEIDSNVATETLEIAPGTLSGFDRTIGEGCLSYATYPVYREYVLYENEGRTVDGHEGYLAESWTGQQRVAINGRADKLCELLVEFEDTDKKTLAIGEKWDIGGGFALTARQINLEGDKVWFSFYKDGKEIDSEVIVCNSGEDHQDRVYTYTNDIDEEDDVPVFSCYVDAIFRGTDSNLVQVKYVFLIDDDVLELGTGDRFGCMEVVTISSAGVILKNDDAIDLDSGTTIKIMDDLYFKTADDSVIRFYPFVERIIGGAVPPVVGDYIFDSKLNVNEGIVIENSINIEVVGVGTGMGNYAKFRISSYQKPTRIVTIYQGDIPTKYDTQFGASIYIDVTGVCRNDSVRFRVTGPKNWRVTEYYVVEPVEESISDTDGDGVPDVWDMDNSTPPGHWTDSDGCGRRWGDMNGDGKLTSVDALMILQAAAGNMHYPRTIVDSNGDEITIYKPVERIIAYNSDGAEVIRSLGATGDVVGVGTVVAEDDFFPEFAEVPTVGKWNSPNCEMIIALNPDIVLVYGKWPEKGKLEDKLRGTDIKVIRLNLYVPANMTSDVQKLGVVLEREGQAQELIDFYQQHTDLVGERVGALPEEERQTMYLEGYSDFKTVSAGSGGDQMCAMAGGINIAHNLIGTYPKVDSEWVIAQNPDLVIKAASSSYDNTSEPDAVLNGIVSRPGWADMDAVRNDRVHILTSDIYTGPRYVVGGAYMAQWLYPDLFADLDPSGVHQEYLERFHSMEMPDEVFVYPE